MAWAATRNGSLDGYEIFERLNNLTSSLVSLWFSITQPIHNNFLSVLWALVTTFSSWQHKLQAATTEAQWVGTWHKTTQTLAIDNHRSSCRQFIFKSMRCPQFGVILASYSTWKWTHDLPTRTFASLCHDITFPTRIFISPIDHFARASLYSIYFPILEFVRSRKVSGHKPKWTRVT